MVQEREGGLQPAAQAGNQAGAARQARGPGEWRGTPAARTCTAILNGGRQNEIEAVRGNIRV